MNIAIFGAAGAIGPVVAAELLARGHNVRSVGRDRSRLLDATPGAEPFVADLAEPVAARAAAAGMDAIVYAVGVPYHRFDLHPALTRVTLEAARAAGVGRLLHVSTVYPYGRPQTERVSETHPLDAHTRKGRWRREQEALVADAHDPNGLRTLILRPPDFYGPTADNSMAAYALANMLAGKTVDLLAPVDTPHEWMYVPDAAPIVADLLARADAFDGSAYNIAGAGTLTMRQFAAKLFAAAGRPVRTREAGHALLRLVGVVNPLMRELAEMSYLYETPVLLDDTKLQTLLGPLHKTSYDDGIRATVAAALATSVPA